MKNIRNFCIIAHIDHGKSTLADRFLEYTGLVEKGAKQVLDDMELEKEKGITIKSRAVRMLYKKGKEEYIYNLIDTPGHVDFSYEVSRSLASCEGALLLVDAAQGIEAQTMSNLYLAIENGLDIIPVINKIDLPAANVPLVEEDIWEIIGECNVYKISAKDGIGIPELLDGIAKEISAPKKGETDEVKALIFDSFYDKYKGVVILVRIFSGSLKKGDNILLKSNKREYKIDELGYLGLKQFPQNSLQDGEVGYIVAGIKNIADARVGDTLTLAENPCKTPLAGFKKVKPMIYSGIFPINADEYQLLRDAMAKLNLNDASLVYEPENSLALGFGFRCGFLGMLHLEIVKERLNREYDLAILTTSPSVPFYIHLKDEKEILEIHNPINFPDPTKIEYIEEPFVSLEIITPKDYIGNIMNLAIERRGIQTNMQYLDKTRIAINYDIPLIEIIFDFYDKLKSYSKGYASMDYAVKDYRKSNIVKVDILINEEKVDAMSFMVHESKAYQWGKNITETLSEVIPKHLYKIALQAAINNKIIARSTINATRKNVTAKCYGGDISRKRKLLEKQKEGKKKMKEIGTVSIPQEAFLSVLKADK